MKGVKLVIFLLPFFLPCALFAQEIVLRGRVLDPQGNALPNASVQLFELDQVLAHATSGPHGQFLLRVSSPGDFVVKADAPGFCPVTRPINARPIGNPEIELQMTQLSSRIENVTVTADVNESDVLSPDPTEKVFVRQELLDANPGRPGAPVSIPGYPIETASSGIKAPQYFAPGVAGDHGEPIAQYIAVGSYLVSNNLSPTRTATAMRTQHIDSRSDRKRTDRRRSIQRSRRQPLRRSGCDLRTCAPASIHSSPLRETTATSMWSQD